MTNPTIRFIRRGQVVTLVNVPPTRTLLEVLREDLGSTGTKEGCGEGDCGACTVVLGEAVEGRIEYRAINACIRLAHSIDGLALWTAEDLTVDPLIGPSRPQTVASGRRSRFAPGSGGAGAVPRLAMRLLHAGLCHEPVRALSDQGTRRARHPRRRGVGPVRQPVPLHRLPAHR
jgi:ferredoxin